MQSEEQRLIDGLFTRLQQAETQSGPREAGAEALIAEHIKQQPGAPYYMAQTILIQEAAIKQLSSRVEALEAEATRLRDTARPASGGFLAGLFGGGQKVPASEPGYNQTGGAAPIPGTRSANNVAGNAGYAAPAQQQPARGGGFMAGALQTAAGVAGGVVLGNMLTSMFHQSAPEEIVNIINEPEKAATDALADNGVDTSALTDNGDDSLVQNASWQDDGNDYGNDYGNDDFGGDDFGDDDSWV